MFKKMITVGLTAILSASISMQVFALTASEDTYVPKYSLEQVEELTDGLFTPMVHNKNSYSIVKSAENEQEAKAIVKEKLDSIPGVSYAYAKNVFYTPNSDGTYDAWLIAKYTDYLLEPAALCRSWLDSNMQAIIPSGTDMESAIQLCADYIADHVQYDWDGRYSKKELQTAYHGMYDGWGICATYALMFNAMIEYLPFNEAGVVDYVAGSAHLNADYLTGVDHAWSGVQVGAEYRQYDITNYTLNNKSGKYFNMTTETLASRAAYRRTN